MRRLVRAVDGDVEVGGLLRGERSELNVKLGKVRARDFLVELLREHVDAELKLAGVRPESDLGEDLVRERAGHDEGGMTGSAARGDIIDKSDETYRREERSHTQG